MLAPVSGRHSPRPHTPSTRRPAAGPSNLHSSQPQPKPTQPKAITAEEWEARAPLGDIQLRSIENVRKAGEVPPLPLKFATEESPSRSSTPLGTRSKLLPGSGSRPGTPSLSASASRLSNTSHSLLPKQPISTPQQFYDWFALIDRHSAHSQDAHFRSHLELVKEYVHTADALAGKVDEIEREVTSMEEGWRGVEEGGKSLKETSERLLLERDTLLATTTDIASRLEYFHELESATRMLNHPGDSLVLQTDFLYMVERVDICIDYLKDHPHYKESPLYLLRFQQCLVRAMTLIKMYFSASLRALLSSTSTTLSSLTNNSASLPPSAQASHHLLYTRFHTVSTQLRPLLGELERRAAKHLEELSALLGECRSAYFGARRSLVGPLVAQEIRGLDPRGSELVGLVREGCSYLRQLCAEEFELYRAFFSGSGGGVGKEEEAEVYSYLETMCDQLYDDLRPRILHEQRLGVLGEVCEVVGAMMALDSSLLAGSSSSSETSDDDDDDDEEEDEESEDETLDLDLDPRKRRSQSRTRTHTLHTSHLLQPILQDAQTRLFFKAQSVVQAEVRYYTPKPEDLSYPESLLLASRRRRGSQPILTEKTITTLGSGRDDTLYPPVRNTARVLAHLRPFVKREIFEEIAREAVEVCRGAVSTGAEKIASSAGKGASPAKPTVQQDRKGKGREELPELEHVPEMDAQLFRVRHLLVLKEMAGELEASQEDEGATAVDLAVDLPVGAVTDALASILSGATNLLPEAVMERLGLGPTSKAGEVGMRGIDADLKIACEEVIRGVAEPITKELSDWILSASASSESEKAPLVSRPDAEAAVSLAVAFRDSCVEKLELGARRLRLYLEDERTAEVLLGHVRDKVVEDYLAFSGVVRGVFGESLPGGENGESALMAKYELSSLLVSACQRDG